VARRIQREAIALISPVLVDTDVVSFIFKGDTRATVYSPLLDNHLTAVSFVTIAELDRWTLGRNWGTARKEKLAEFLHEFVVIHSTRALCLKWAEVIDNSVRKGHPIDSNDAWIAATALLHGVPLVTNNKAHFLWVEGLTLI
jgi:tRNA(fMet)-specific endonuclease VapC